MSIVYSTAGILSSAHIMSESDEILAQPGGECQGQTDQWREESGFDSNNRESVNGGRETVESNPDREKRMLKNVLLLGTAFLLMYTAFQVNEKLKRVNYIKYIVCIYMYRRGPRARLVAQV